MRQDIYLMWSIQESLLQQYRVMAITLMGLIAAGILVAMSRLSDAWVDLEGSITELWQDNLDLRNLADLTIFAMLLTLLLLGVRAGLFFHKITRERAGFVTFYQNLLLAEEAGQLEVIAARHGVQYPVELLGVLRRLSNRRFTPLSFERHIHTHKFDDFRNEILQIETANSRPEIRHNVARNFLSDSIFFVFYCFFFFCGIHALITLVHLF